MEGVKIYYKQWQSVEPAYKIKADFTHKQALELSGKAKLLHTDKCLMETVAKFYCRMVSCL